MDYRFTKLMRKHDNNRSGHNGLPKSQYSGHEKNIIARGSITLSTSMAESEERQLMLRLENLAQIEGLREDRARIKIPSTMQVLVDSKANDSEVLKNNGSVALEGPFTFKELMSEPPDPSEGHVVMWMSNGTGSGDNGDIMVKVTTGGTTKSFTLVDFSSI